jgi:uncharacterized protein
MVMTDSAHTHPPYERIVALLLKPFLSEPEALRVDCEYLPTHARLWVRIAFAEGDRQRVLGGGNRHLYAIKTILTTAGRQAGQSVYLDVYGGTGGEPRAARSEHRDRTERRERPDRPNRTERPSKAGRPQISRDSENSVGE